MVKMRWRPGLHPRAAGELKALPRPPDWTRGEAREGKRRGRDEGKGEGERGKVNGATPGRGIGVCAHLPVFGR